MKPTTSHRMLYSPSDSGAETRVETRGKHEKPTSARKLLPVNFSHGPILQPRSSSSSASVPPVRNITAVLASSSVLISISCDTNNYSLASNPSSLGRCRDPNNGAVQHENSVDAEDVGKAVGQVMQATAKSIQNLNVIEQEAFLRGMVNFMEHYPGLRDPQQKSVKTTATQIFELGMKQFEFTEWDDKFFIDRNPTDSVEFASYQVFLHLTELKKQNADTFDKVIRKPVRGKVTWRNLASKLKQYYKLHNCSFKNCQEGDLLERERTATISNIPPGARLIEAVASSRVESDDGWAGILMLKINTNKRLLSFPVHEIPQSHNYWKTQVWDTADDKVPPHLGVPRLAVALLPATRSTDGKSMLLGFNYCPQQHMKHMIPWEKLRGEANADAGSNVEIKFMVNCHPTPFLEYMLLKWSMGQSGSAAAPDVTPQQALEKYWEHLSVPWHGTEDLLTQWATSYAGLWPLDKIFREVEKKDKATFGFVEQTEVDIIRKCIEGKGVARS
eukprot:g37050.t1